MVILATGSRIAMFATVIAVIAHITTRSHTLTLTGRLSESHFATTSCGYNNPNKKTGTKSYNYSDVNNVTQF